MFIVVPMKRLSIRIGSKVSDGWRLARVLSESESARQKEIDLQVKQLSKNAYKLAEAGSYDQVVAAFHLRFNVIQ